MLSASAASNPYEKMFTSNDVNETWYTWNIVKEKSGVELPKWGKPMDWYSDAKNAGYSVGTTPKANSIVVWESWASGGQGRNVGYVEKVDGNKIYVWEVSLSCYDTTSDVFNDCMSSGEDENVCFSKTDKVACPHSTNPEEFGIVGYIYLDNIPKKETSTSTKNDKKEETVTKSNNAYLSKIVLSEGSIEFKKDTFEYNLEVENSVEKVSVTGTLEDSKASITGNGEYALEVGLNEVKLVVTAEDKTTKEYKINITRKDVEVEEKEGNVTNETLETEESKRTKDSKQVKVVGVVAGALAIVGGVTTILIKKRKLK